MTDFERGAKKAEKLISWIVIFALVLALVFGCKTVEKSKSSTSQSSSETVTERISGRDTAAIVTNSSRSLDTQIKQHVSGSLIIYPRGEFTIAADGTFKGQADSVVSNQTKTLEETRSEQDTLQKTETKASETAGEKIFAKSSESETEDSETKRKPSLMPWIGAALGILLLVVGLHLYFRKKGRL